MNPTRSMTVSKYLGIGVLVFLIAGCGGGLTPSQPAELNPGTLIADFPDGSTFTATDAHAVISGGMIEVTATEKVNGVSEELVLVFPTGTAPYSVSVPSDPDASAGYNDVNHDQYDAKGHTGSCTFHISQTTPTVIGTFSATVVNSTVPGDVRTVTFSNGTFNAN